MCERVVTREKLIDVIKECEVRDTEEFGVVDIATPIAEAIEKACPNAVGQCDWTKDFDGEYFDTSCGRAFVLIEDNSLNAHEYYYCPSCGRPIVEKPNPLLEEATDE